MEDILGLNGRSLLDVAEEMEANGGKIPEGIGQSEALDELVKNDAQELNDMMTDVPAEHRERLLGMLANNDTEGFEREIARLTGSGNPDTQGHDAQEQSPQAPMSYEVLMNVLTYFNREALSMEQEARQAEKDLLGRPDEITMSEADSRAYLQSDNPYTRLMLATHGLYPDVLKHDSYPIVRLEVLRQTGKYSDFYRERESNLNVIKELISQGIDHDYYRKLSDVTRTMVENQEIADEIIGNVSSGNRTILHEIMVSIEAYDNSGKLFFDNQKAMGHINFIVESSLKPLNE